jgi:hypothetical protein
MNKKYIIEQNGVRRDGLTAADVRVLLESEASADVKVYKIHAVRPDGTVELKGMPHEIFELESGMFFYAIDFEAAQQVYEQLASLSASFARHCKCSIGLSKDADGYVVSLIYPAEYEDEISAVLLEEDLRFNGAVCGGISEVSNFYAKRAEVLESTQAIAEVTQNSGFERTA